jgi:predicted metal-dependent hydrolase/8-oxo-dGTP pyrophosphatase MutT (NUDIX family)
VNDGLQLGLRQIERGEYFEAHESLEDVWRAAEPAEKDFFQGLVHVAVAWYQASRGNRVGCERQLEKAARRLAPFAPEHRGLNLEILLRSVQRASERVASGSLELAAPVLAASETPYGCAVIVWREGRNGREYLILHRVTDHGPNYEGDWAWTPPSGVRHPAEDAGDTAERELREETGLDLPVTLTEAGDQDWPVYAAKAPQDADVVLNEEHDRFRWAPADEAERLCLPAIVGGSIRAVDVLLELKRS